MRGPQQALGVGLGLTLSSIPPLTFPPPLSSPIPHVLALQTFPESSPI